MIISEQERKRRRLTYRLVQLVLVVLSIGIVVALVSNRRGATRDSEGNVRIGSGGRVGRGRSPDVTFSTTVPTAQQLGQGDMQLFNEDSTVDLILQGPHILAGLSPKTVERIRSEIGKAGPDDSSGLAGFIASTVKEQVADKIGTHARYNVADIRDIRLESDRLVIEWKSGKEQRLFESVKVDRDRGNANRFRPDEARRFIELVKARQAALDPSGQGR
jgi:hypothetical protein